jgi:hypothetical protein
MTDPIRRKILKTGAAATVTAAAPRVFAQQTGQGGAAMSFYEKGPVRIRIPLAVRQIRSFLRAHRPASV